MTTSELEEEVRWFLTWHMTPERISSLVGMSVTALRTRFRRAGIKDLTKVFAYSETELEVSRRCRARKKANA